MNSGFLSVLLVMAGLLVLFYIINENNQKTKEMMEDYREYFENSMNNNNNGSQKQLERKPRIVSNYNPNKVAPSEPLKNNETFKEVKTMELAKNPQEIINNSVDLFPVDCFLKDQLNPQELLPGNANSIWAKVNPNTQGELGDQNFLSAGFHTGINTVGSSLRNANRQLRSDPIVPQIKVGPWMQSTIQPDLSRRPLEIGS